MISFGHTAVGVIIGISAYQFLGSDNLAGSLIITGSVGFVAHYVMDAIPHGHFFMGKNYKDGIVSVIIFDLSLSIILFLGLLYFKEGFSEKFLYAMFGIGGSQLPDVIDGLIYIKIIKAKGLLKTENKLHQAIHWHDKNLKPLLLSSRDLWQILIVLIALILAIFSN